MASRRARSCSKPSPQNWPKSLHNPYEPPSEIDSDGGSPPPKTRTVSLETISFITDWSRTGLRERRRRSFYPVLDTLFISFTLVLLVLIGSVFLSEFSFIKFNRSIGSSCCCMIPLWLPFAAIMFGLWGHRSASTVANNARGLAGKVIGRIHGPWLTLIGPQVSVCAHLQTCSVVKLERERLVLQFPGCSESFQVAAGDIIGREKQSFGLDELLTPTRFVMSKQLPYPFLAASQIWLDRASRMLDSLENDRSHSVENAIVVSGSLRGRDLRGTFRYRRWHVLGASLTACGIAGFAAAYWRYATMPPWVRNRPSHYLPTESESFQFTLVYILLLTGLIFLLVGLFQWIKVRSQVGDFAAAITPDRVIIASNLVTYAYTGDALKHFRWTPQGLAIQIARRSCPSFLIPVGWMNAAQASTIAAWFAATEHSPIMKPGFYMRPLV